MHGVGANVAKAGASAAVLFLGLLSVQTAPKARAGQAFKPADSQLLVRLGESLFNDTTLSNPSGMACVSCHDPSTGFSFPNSDINASMGPVPGALAGRFGFRKPPTASYAAYLPTGIPTYDAAIQAYMGGLFYDGRVPDTTTQAEKPFLNPNEMNNLVHNVGSPAMVVAKLKLSPSADLFKAAYGPDVFEGTTDEVYTLMANAIAAFEQSPKVSPFSSKYDAYEAGLVQLTPEELEGLRIVTGSLSGRPGGIPFRVNAHCSECHGIPTVKGDGPDLWTNSCYANLGVPKNPNNPYYKETNRYDDPAGYNPLGYAYIDYGLGDFYYPYEGLPVADLAQDDPLAIDGTFKTPTLRNVDKRPYPTFVKCYMHNGCFKSLAQVVHFYNTRNLTTYPGEVINFTLTNPYADLQGYPLWPHPEWPSPVSMINPTGQSSSTGDGDGTNDEQIGNIGLSTYEEGCIVAFLQTLSDGYFNPSTGSRSNPVRP